MRFMYFFEIANAEEGYAQFWRSCLIAAALGVLQSEMSARKFPQIETPVELDALLPAILDKAFKGEL